MKFSGSHQHGDREVPGSGTSCGRVADRRSACGRGPCLNSAYRKGSPIGRVTAGSGEDQAAAGCDGFQQIVSAADVQPGEVIQSRSS